MKTELSFRSIRGNMTDMSDEKFATLVDLVNREAAYRVALRANHAAAGHPIIKGVGVNMTQKYLVVHNEDDGPNVYTDRTNITCNFGTGLGTQRYNEDGPWLH